MTKARFNEDNEICRLVISDHAGYNPGNDIVCAGISAIAYTMAGYLHNKKEVEILDETIKDGFFSITFRGDEYASEVYHAIWIGLLQIEKKFPSHLVVYRFTEEKE